MAIPLRSIATGDLGVRRINAAMKIGTERPTRPHTEILKNMGPLWAYPFLPLLMASVFFYFAWDAYSHPHESYRKLYKVVFEAFGNNGVVALNLIFGFVLLIVAVVVYRRMKVIYKRIEGA